MADNQTIADLFEEMADILEIQDENRFKIRAYRMAADRIRGLGSPLDKVTDKKQLTAIEGIGDALADKILEINRTGDFKAHREAEQEISPGLLEMLRIEGLGPKRVAQIHKQLGITTLAELAAAGRTGKIAGMAGFGAKIQENIVNGLNRLEESRGRFCLDEVLPLAEKIIDTIRKIKGVKQVSPAGSLRRFKETVRDLDILVTGIKPAAKTVMETFITLPEAAAVLQNGKTKSSIRLKNGLQVDLRFVVPSEYGAALQYFTGSKEHNVRVREIAKDNEYKVNEYGIFTKEEKRVAGKTEVEMYRTLGLDYIEPELRENTGELYAAMESQLPKLITLADLRGDLQMHTTMSDGTNTLEQMIEACLGRGYKFMAITEHSQSVRVANGLDDDRLLRWIEEIRKTAGRYKNITVLTGIEVDILKNAKLDLNDRTLEQCDVVVAAVHSNFKMPPADLTKRIIDGISHPAVNILAHPTTRIINEREPLNYDIEQIMEVARKQQVAMEVNSHPRRLDLKDSQVRIVIERGGYISINTDAHSIAGLDAMRYGIGTARRGWCAAANCINSFTTENLKKYLDKKQE